MLELNDDPVKTLVQTRGGHAARILMYVAGQRHPIIGAVFEENRWRPESWTEEGRNIDGGEDQSRYDLENKPVIHEQYINFWRDGANLRGEVHPDRETARQHRNSDTIASLRLSVPEGRFDD